MHIYCEKLYLWHSESWQKRAGVSSGRGLGGWTPSRSEVWEEKSLNF